MYFRGETVPAPNPAFMPKIAWPVLLSLAAGKLLLHLWFINNYGFHRDAFLYLALGRHPAFGYWSNGPLIGWISWLVQHTLGGALWATRLPVVAASCALLLLAGLMARQLGGGRFAQGLAAGCILLSPAYLRTGHQFQPVAFDILAWAGATFLILRFFNSDRQRYILWFGLLFGLGFLNKYSVVFLLLALLVALLLSPDRRVIGSRATGQAALFATVLILPNILWQYFHHWPVAVHLQELSATQLGNVRPVNFLLDQLMENGATFLVWLPGLLWLLLGKAGRRHRTIGWLYLAVIALFLALSGKSYYTLGLYPVLMAAGAVAWERWARRWWARASVPLVMAVLMIPIFPMGVPVLPLDRFVEYCHWLSDTVGFDAPMRWEDGRIHELPQDFADMLGWDELARLAEQAVEQAGEPVLLYAENYGQAGAIDHLGRDLPPAVSFADSYRLWLPDTTSAQALVYVNDELGKDVADLFADIRLIGQVEHPYAREHGTKVYLCRRPRQPLGPFWAERVRMVMGGER